MENFSSKNIKGLERFNANINLRIPIIVSYLLLMIVLKEVFGILFPYIAFLLVSFMLLSSLALAFYFDKFPPRGATILNIYFFYNIFDLFLLTVVIYYLGGVTWIGFIFYSFYFILNFMTFARSQALFLTIWIIFLYLLSVFFQYFQILPSFSLFLPGSQTHSNFPFVLTTVASFIATFILVAYYTQGFYQLYARKISELNTTKEILEKERASLEVRVEYRKGELTETRKGLEARIEERKKELEEEEMVLRERAKELEKFKRIALGREEKLEELNKELTLLKREQKH